MFPGDGHTMVHRETGSQTSLAERTVPLIEAIVGRPGSSVVEGLYLGTVLLKSAETCTDPFSARDLEIVRVSDPETVVEGMLK